MKGRLLNRFNSSWTLGLLPCDLGERKPCVPTTGEQSSVVDCKETNLETVVVEMIDRHWRIRYNADSSRDDDS